jgi:hypothetical protein
VTGPGPEPPLDPAAASLRRGLRAAGALLVLLHGAWALLSWPLVGHLPFGRFQVLEARMLEGWVEALPGLPAGARAALVALTAGGGPLADPALRLAVGATILGGMVAASLAVLALLARARGASHPAVPRTLFRGALAFGAVGLLALPACTQDPWLGIGWGRMVAAGVNPYYEAMGPAFVAGLPIDETTLPFTYGPLWALGLGGVGLLGAGRAALELAVLKAVLGGAWLAALVAVRRLAMPRGPRAEAMAIALFGWLPLSVHYGVAELHNDVAMAALLAWALVLAREGRATAPVALFASAMVKYATAPVLLLDAWRGLREGAGRRGAWRRGALAGLAVALLLFALFARDFEVFAGTRRMSFGILSPAKALRLALAPLPGPGISRELAAGLVLAAVAAAFAGPGLRFLRRPSAEALPLLAFGVLAAVALAALGHTWPWFLVWPLAAGAVLWPAWQLRALAGLLVVAPLFDLFWLQGGGWGAGDPWTLGLFGLAALATPPVAWLLRPSPSVRDELLRSASREEGA